MIRSSIICPWWLSSALDNPIRRLIHNPENILSGYIEKGQTVLDIGCGPGTFTIAMAKMVGESGKVIAVDLQDAMLQKVKKKAAKEKLESRITTHKSMPNRIDISGKVDFALAFYMVHEVHDIESFLGEIASLLKPKSSLLIAEPMLHVSAASFEKTLEYARLVGLKPTSKPKIRLSRAIILQLS